jgi:hypothetical protein
VRRTVEIIVTEVDEAGALIGRDVVVAKTRQAAQAGIAVEGIAAGRVRDQRQKILAPQLFDPRQGCVRTGDDVLPALVVEVAVTHVGSCEADGGGTEARRARVKVGSVGDSPWTIARGV